MMCQVCGSKTASVVTDMPFKVSSTSIVIVRQMPVDQCSNCGQYLIDDPVIERVESIIKEVDSGTELEIVQYAT
ncbi:MAG: type II toxin-antitoxin system MqsA family antitoxin [Chloroflexi bacterium]|nr:type II toxin-antitoxin system MqsA family antitoxin [Chloroflexota bacterium]